jgi:beta-galactosidase
VKVLLNGELIGEAPTTEAEAFKVRFTIPYRPGHLEVVGGSESFVLETAGPPTRLRFIESDSMDDRGDRDLYFAMVEIQDASGTWHPEADRPIEFTVTGGGRIIAVGSGDLTSTESYRENPRRSYQGRMLVVVRADAADASNIMLRAEAEGLEPAEVRVQ